MRNLGFCSWPVCSLVVPGLGSSHIEAQMVSRSVGVGISIDPSDMSFEKTIALELNKQGLAGPSIIFQVPVEVHIGAWEGTSCQFCHCKCDPQLIV